MSRNKLLIFVGTKAQFIKTAPILRELDRRQVEYRLIYTGQHFETFDVLEKAFGTRPADEDLVPGTEAATHASFLLWTMRFWWQALRRIPKWRGALAGLVHGDTASTLFTAIALRLSGVPVVHVEAGLRSSKLLEPFPEEIVRRIVSRLTKLHLAPDAVSARNLVDRRGLVVNTGGNTLKDALILALRGWDALPRMGGAGGYAVVSLHRSENLSRKADFDLLMREIVNAATLLPVYFVLHPATRERIRDGEWSPRLREQPNLHLLNRMDYPEFVKLLVGSSCLLTDGGSNQEEAAMIGLPTLLLRRTTERVDGLGSGVELSNLNPKIIRDFLARHAKKTWGLRQVDGMSPTAAIVDVLVKEFG